MAKIPLSIKTTYLPSWGVYEGVRELIQNARDAEVEHSAAMTVEYVGGVLRIENEGTVLPHQALLLGHTSKEGRSDTIGKFGEGLKLGVLALVRAGHSVKIRSGAEVWVPSITYSEVFQAEVLTFDINGGRQDKNRVRIEVNGISPSMWLGMKGNFLFLEKKKDTRISTPSGTLLLGEEYKGKVFVKGIFVQSLADLEYGYDLQSADLDRDRKMVESWDLQYRTRQVLTAALGLNSDLFAQFDTILQNSSSKETQNLDTHNVHSVPDEAVDYVHKNFVDAHGEDAIPVTTSEDSRDIEQLGARGVFVTRQHGAVLQRKMGALATIKDRLKKEVLAEHPWDSLSVEEQHNLSDAVSLLDPVCGLTLAKVHVVDFRSEGMLGQRNLLSDGEISLSRKVLGDPDRTLQVLIRESAYSAELYGPSQLDRVETIWREIVRNLRRTSRFDRT